MDFREGAGRVLGVGRWEGLRGGREDGRRGNERGGGMVRELAYGS